MALVMAPTNYDKTKHMHAKYMFLWEAVNNQQVDW